MVSRRSKSDIQPMPKKAIRRPTTVPSRNNKEKIASKEEGTNREFMIFPAEVSKNQIPTAAAHISEERLLANGGSEYVFKNKS